MATPRTDELLQYWLFLILFFKNHHKILHLEIKLIFLYFLGVAPKNRSESGQKIGRKKLSESVKNDKKLQSRKFENELRPKSLHHLLPLNERLLKKRCSPYLWPFNLWPWVQLYPKNA